MYSYDALDKILDYLDAFDKDLADEYARASDDVKPLVSAKISVIAEIIDYIERDLGIQVQMFF